MMVNVTRQKLGTRYETLLHSTQLATVWGSTQLSAAGSGLNATMVGRRCFCEWGDAKLCWLSMGSLCKSDFILSNDIQKQIISSEEIDANWDISYKTSSRSCTSKSSSSKDLFLSKICQSKMCHLLKLVLHQTTLRSAAWMQIHLCHGAGAMALATLSSIQVFWASVMPCMGASGPIHCPAPFLAWMA